MRLHARNGPLCTAGASCTSSGLETLMPEILIGVDVMHLLLAVVMVVVMDLELLLWGVKYWWRIVVHRLLHRRRHLYNDN